MDKNTVIGITLIFILFFAWQQLMRPSQEELEAQQRLEDSLAQVENQQLAEAGNTLESHAAPIELPALPDSIRDQQLVGSYGPFAAAATGTEKSYVLENDVIKVTFTNKGGRINRVLLKDFHKIVKDSARKDVEAPLYLMEDEKNRFEYFLPVANLPAGGVNTSDLYFQVEQDGNTIRFVAPAGEGRAFIQTYSLEPNSYQLDYQLNFRGLNGVLANNTEAVELRWINFLDKVEKNNRVERTYATTYYKIPNRRTDNCSRTGNDKEDTKGEGVKWVSNANQFFNSALIANQTFGPARMEVQNLEKEAADLKRLETVIQIPIARQSDQEVAMHFYLGPNEFDQLKAIGDDLEDVIPFGWNIFGTVNRWVIRPLFNWLSAYIGSAGIVILILTLVVKMALYPLTYRMLYSQSKMSALKPEMEKMREKHKDDQQKQQMETMKLYREFGVNPLGSCLPLLLQMPVWFALYRFFPASIDFRQEGFLWANDLSSYDEFFQLPFEVPMGIGAHISLFTLLWAVTTLIYTYYNSRHMDFSAQPAMKYMQYIMPLFFLGFFNSYASGLTAYLLFSNLINILQTIITKNYIIDQKKIKREMDAYRAKPKKKSGFQARLEDALKEQRKIQEQRESAKKKK